MLSTRQSRDTERPDPGVRGAKGIPRPEGTMGLPKASWPFVDLRGVTALLPRDKKPPSKRGIVPEGSKAPFMAQARDNVFNTASETEASFGSLLRELRIARGLRLVDLGHPTTIHHYESGRNFPRSRETVRAIAKKLSVDSSVLFEALGWSNGPVSQRVQAVRALISSSPEEAAAAAQKGLDRAVSLGMVDELYQWQLTLSQARRTIGAGPLPVDFRGRGDLDAWRVRATELIQQDAWFAAAVVLESLLAFMPPDHGSYGKTLYNLAVAQAALGEYSTAEQHARHGWQWACDHQDYWLSVMMCESVAHYAVADRRTAPPDAISVLRYYQGDVASRRFVDCWLDDAMAHDAACRGDWRTAQVHAAALKRRVAQYPEELGSESLRAAKAQAMFLWTRGQYQPALAVLDPALMAAVDQGTPGYQLIDSLILAGECAWLGHNPDASWRISWLEGWLGGLSAFSHLTALAQRLGVTNLGRAPTDAAHPAHYRAFWG